jgi:hypothetical protein
MIQMFGMKYLISIGTIIMMKIMNYNLLLITYYL